MSKKLFRAAPALLFFLCSALYLLGAAALHAPPHTPPERPYEACPESSDDTGLDPSKPAVALTFDDGPHPKYTDMILDTLEENSARGTFFIIGKRINLGLPQIRRILLSLIHISFAHSSIP